MELAAQIAPFGRGFDQPLESLPDPRRRPDLSNDLPLQNVAEHVLLDVLVRRLMTFAVVVS